tara:strand:- start:44 stop:589 length:546 start_codon:yes stop_codon:yes gene_type:complete
MKTQKDDTLTITLTKETKKLLKQRAKKHGKTLSEYVLYKLSRTYTEWTKENTIKTTIQLGKIFDGGFHQIQCEIPVSYLKCMPIYKWQYCHEVLKGQEGYCDWSFNQFINELRFHFTCASRLIKLDCLDKLERKSLISLFKRELKKEGIFDNTRRGKEFLQAVEELKTNRNGTKRKHRSLI